MGLVVIGFLALSWVYWHLSRWLAVLMGWVDPGDGAVAAVTLLSAGATIIVLFYWRQGGRPP